MNKPEYKVTPTRYKRKIAVDVFNIKSANLIIEQLVGIGADEHECYKIPYSRTDVLGLVINLEKINVSIKSIRDVLSEHDNKIRQIIQKLTAEEINIVLPEIASVTEDLSEDESIKINMNSDKFNIGCYVYDRDMFDCLGLDIEKCNVQKRNQYYISITFDSIHDLRKLNLLGIMDLMRSPMNGYIEIPGFVFDSYPLI